MRTAPGARKVGPDDTDELRDEMRKNFQTSGFPACKLYGQLPVKFMPSTGNLRAITGNLRAIYGQVRATLRAIYGQLYGPPEHGIPLGSQTQTATVSVSWLAFSRTHLN
eukprot:gene13118-biopygen16999